MLKVKFSSLAEAVEHGRMHGGWIAHTDGNTIWYNAMHYTLSTILVDPDSRGTIKPWRAFE